MFSNLNENEGLQFLLKSATWIVLPSLSKCKLPSEAIDSPLNSKTTLTDILAKLPLTPLILLGTTLIVEGNASLSSPTTIEDEDLESLKLNSLSL